MKIQELGSLNPTPVHGTQTNQQMSAREKAIEALMRPNTPAQQAAQQPTPVPNPSSISPEEVGALKTPFERAVESAKSAETGQNNLNESTSSTAAPEETKPVEEPLSPRYADLARKERAIRQREQLLKQRESAIKAAEEAAKVAPKSPETDLSKYVPKDRLTQDPFTVLSELGLTYDQLTEMALNGPKPQEIALMNEMKALKDEISRLKGDTQKSFEEREKLQRTQAISQIKAEASNLVKNNSSFETIKATGSVDDVVELIEKTFDQDGVLLSVEEAAQQVEDYLVEEAMRLTKLSKIQQRLQPKSTPAAPQKPTTQPEQPQMKTLTNNLASSRPLSAKERAILAFQGKLNK